jgi:hypothetical protein
MHSRQAHQPIPENKRKHQPSAISAEEIEKRAGIPARFLFCTTTLYPYFAAKGCVPSE